MRVCSRSTGDDGLEYDSLIGTLLLVTLIVLPGVALGQTELLRCGVPVQRFLPDGDTHEYRFTTPPGARVLVHAIGVSGLGFIKKRVARAGDIEPITETCTGPSLEFDSPGGEIGLRISDCFGDGEGVYTLTYSIVSDDTDNCALPLSCGTTSDGIDLQLEGEADSYSFEGIPGQQARLQLDPLDDSAGTLQLKVFDPEGRVVSGGDESCDSPVTLTAGARGLYTAVVNACPGQTRPVWTGLYRLGYETRDCPAGPEITYFGIASSQAFPRFPDAHDFMNRPVYIDGQGSGFILVVEAREGTSETKVGLTTLGDPLPDMQMLVSRDLGNGDPTVCDIGPPRPGGVAASPDLAFNDDGEVIDALNDIGCRFDDGLGNPAGRDLSIEACTRSMRDFGFGFVDLTTTTQFCAEVTQSWGFLPGDTVVAARLTDLVGNVGARREIVVRVPGDTPTPTRTPTLSGTRTPTPTRGAIDCVGDCNGDAVVDVDELVKGISIALGRLAPHYCWGIDGNEDGSVSIDELVDGVTNALDECAVP